MQPAGAPPVDDDPLPPLRAELRIMPAADDAARQPGYLIHDPVRNRYFRISALAAKVLGHWAAGGVGALRRRLAAKEGLHVRGEDIAGLIRFLRANHLTASDSAPLRALQRRMERSPLKKALHGYLFFRVPLVRPQRFLEAAYPYVRWLGTKAGLIPLILVSLLGVFMTMRQWDAFAHTFFGFVNLQGLMLFGLTLMVVKVGHELGHAFIALRHGCRVPSMGVAFMVMVPMFYTDVTDAWRVRSRRGRLLIGMGGMLVELGLAGLALFAWAFLPDGAWRTAAFFVATTSLLTTLLINASPFMRFDGYHILADALRMHNLQPRAFALALWKLKRWLFAVDEPPPEAFGPRLERFLIAYAFATWIYRLALFLGIALIVYHAFPKVVGIFLAAVEIIWFILLPVWRVVKKWWEERMDIRERGHFRRPLVAGAVLLILLFAPLWGTVRLPAVMMTARQFDAHVPEAARVVALHVNEGQRVAAGAPMVTLTSRALDEEERKARIRLKLVRLRLRRLAASRADLRQHEVLKRQLASLQSRLRGIAKRREALVIRAPFAGVVRHVMPGLKPGVRVAPEALLARLVDPAGAVVRALAPEGEVARLRAGARARFVAADPLKPVLPVRLEEIGAVRREGRDLTYLASLHGGPVAAQRDEKGRVQTRKGMFPVLLSPQDAGAPPCLVACTGTVLVTAERRSIAGRMARRIAAVLLRESGF